MKKNFENKKVITPTPKSIYRKIKLGEMGFISTIIIIVIALALLKYFLDFDPILFFKKPEVQNILKKGWGIVNGIWDPYLSRPFNYVWNEIVIEMIWNNIKGIFDK